MGQVKADTYVAVRFRPSYTDEGLAGEYGDYAHIGWNTWRRRLRDYKVGALVEEHGPRPPFDHRLRITAAARRLYEREWGALPRAVPRSRRGARARAGAQSLSLMAKPRDDEDWIDTAQICFEGHVITVGITIRPEEMQPFCARCGVKTITACPQCGSPIRGVHQLSGVTFYPNRRWTARASVPDAVRNARGRHLR